MSLRVEMLLEAQTALWFHELVREANMQPKQACVICMERVAAARSFPCFGGPRTLRLPPPFSLSSPLHSYLSSSAPAQVALLPSGTPHLG